MRPANQKDIVAQISCGELRVNLIVHGAAYNPDVVDDLVRRTSDLWKSAAAVAQETGMLDAIGFGFDDEDEDDEASDADEPEAK